MADSSNMNSSDVMKEIMEQTSNLEEGVEQEPEYVEQAAPQEEEVQEQEESQPEEPSQEATSQEQEPEPEMKPPLRIKYKGKDVEIPDDKIKEYAQKGYRYEEKVQELNAKFKQPISQEPVDFSKIDEEFVAELQKSPVKTLMQFTKTILESTDRERSQQRKVDREIEKEFSANIPIWDAIREDYQDYRSEGYPPATALKLAQGDFFTNQYFDSKQKGVEEGEKKAKLKQMAKMPMGSKKGAPPTDIPDVKDLRNMTSDQILKQAFGGKIVRNPNW